jgi:hypothetical protein
VTLPTLKLHNFAEVDIWGDPQVAIYEQPLVANSATAKALIAQGVLQVSQL